MRLLSFAMLGLFPATLLAFEATTVTNIAQIRASVGDQYSACFHVILHADVWWASSEEHKLVLHDESGAIAVEVVLTGTFPHAGERILLEGDGTITQIGDAYRLGAIGPVVDNNGIHSMVERSGAVCLKTGRNPFQVDWFNGVEKFGLEVSYEGPGLQRQPIPDGALFCIESNAAVAVHFINGLHYDCVDANGEVLPIFNTLPPLKSGIVSNLDLSIIPRSEHIAVRFNGWVDVPRAGLYRFFLKSDDGSQLFTGTPTFESKVIGRFIVPEAIAIVPGQIWNDGNDCQWAQAEGTVTFIGESTNIFECELGSGAGKMRVEIVGNASLTSAALLNNRIRVTGVCESVITADGQKVAGTFLVSGPGRIELLDGNEISPDLLKTNLPLLTTCSEVHHLSRNEAQRAYPVRIRGVVTCILPERSAFTIQDSTRALYVEDWSETRSSPPQIGDYLELEGTTDPSLFAPIAKAFRLNSLGAGKLPEPTRPTWDQLLNGSLDAQYVELQGIITAVTSNSVTLLTRDGRIKLELRVNEMNPNSLTNFEDALVRVRGTLLASWDYVTHEVKAGEIRIYGAEISVDAPAPADLFAIPAKTVAQLQLFDPQASVFQRAKVSGQILFTNSENFLTDGQNGLRFSAKKMPELHAGDLVEVVGFPQLSGASPFLREAVVKKTGHSELPPPRDLPVDNPVKGKFDASRVRVRGTLISVRETTAQQIFELQTGVRSFVARLEGKKFDPPPVGSKMELIGIYSGLGGDKAIGQDISSFELLLNSASDIRVLSRPPWWTLERLLFIVGALVCGLALTGLWISQLRRKVEQRTAELEVQIRERQRVEHQRAMEQERARVAQDLHDELGSSLTEISMLGARAQGSFVPEEKRKSYLEQMSEKARAMVTALDEIVWAMNPRHDSLSSLVSYFCLYADRFLGLANIAWRLDDSTENPETEIDSHCRHQLFLAFKEALTNIVRHSEATEVRMNITLQNDEVRLMIADNGRGLREGIRTEEMDGVNNMRTRLEKLKGRFEISSQPGCGVTVNFYVPTKYDHRRHC